MADAAFSTSPPTEGHIRSTAWLCLAIFRKHGMRSAMNMLLEAARQFIPVTRINGVFISRDGSSILNIFDTHPNDRMVSYYLSPELTASLTAGQTAWKVKRAIRLEDIGAPTLINDLSPYKKPELLRNPLGKGIPFLAHNSLARLPLFVMEPFVFVINFWADVIHAFPPGCMELLRELVEPLGRELGETLASSGADMREGELPSWPCPERDGAFANGGREPEFEEKQRPFLDFYVKQLESCPGLRGVCELIRKVARTGATVVIQGETGVGKEFVACAIHEQSARKDKPFITVNCGAIPAGLVESELFGHERGAFTGAVSARKGYFEQAQGGTIFLDEIGDLPLSAQVKLLRVLEKGHLTRVGGSRSMRLDVRIIAATNADLSAKMRRGTFRRDLWYRLAVFPLLIPPLRERPGDIPHLVRDFLSAKSRELGMEFRGVVSEKELRRLYAYDWPGNVRELEHVVERSLILHGDEVGPLRFALPDMPPDALPDGEQRELSGESTRSAHRSRSDGAEQLASLLEEKQEQTWPTLRELEELYIRKALEKTGGRLLGPDGATAILGIHYSTLRARMLNMGLPLPREAQRKTFSGGN